MFGRSRSEQQAFAEVVACYQGVLLRYAGRLLQGRVASAEDVVQNAFLKCAARWKQPMRPSAELSAWLYRVVHNEALDHMRRERRRLQLHRRHAEEPTLARQEGPPRALVGDAAAQAAEALDILSERERQVVLLKVYEEKSYRQISDITGLSGGNVGYILHGAMRKLADHLKARKEGSSDAAGT